jgi:hypothetical protein
MAVKCYWRALRSSSSSSRSESLHPNHRRRWSACREQKKNDETVGHIIKSVEKRSSCEGSCNFFIGMGTIRGRGEAVQVRVKQCITDMSGCTAVRSAVHCKYSCTSPRSMPPLPHSIVPRHDCLTDGTRHARHMCAAGAMRASALVPGVLQVPCAPQGASGRRLRLV